jgi:hypothetical protein
MRNITLNFEIIAKYFFALFSPDRKSRVIEFYCPEHFGESIGASDSELA